MEISILRIYMVLKRAKQRKGKSYLKTLLKIYLVIIIYRQTFSWDMLFLLKFNVSMIFSYHFIVSFSNLFI